MQRIVNALNGAPRHTCSNSFGSPSRSARANYSSSESARETPNPASVPSAADFSVLVFAFTAGFFLARAATLRVVRFAALRFTAALRLAGDFRAAALRTGLRVDL